MNTTTTYAPRSRFFSIPALETVAAWLLAIIWIFPLLYAFLGRLPPQRVYGEL